MITVRLNRGRHSRLRYSLPMGVLQYSPDGPRGQKVEGNQPLVGWGAPLGPPPMRLGLGTLGWGSSPLPWGARQPLSPLVATAPLEILSPGPAPTQGAYIKGGREGSNLQPWAPPSSPATPLSLSQKLGETLPETRYIHHHAVVLFDLHQPLLPPCWIKKEETSLHRTCVERGGAVRSALGHR